MSNLNFRGSFFGSISQNKSGSFCDKSEEEIIFLEIINEIFNNKIKQGEVL